MKKILCLCLFIFSSLVYAGDKWPIGFWNMLDDFTEQPEAIIEFYATPNGIEGKLNKVFYDPEDEVIENCIHCTGDNKDKPLVGLVTCLNRFSNLFIPLERISSHYDHAWGYSKHLRYCFCHFSRSAGG